MIKHSDSAVPTNIALANTSKNTLPKMGTIQTIFSIVKAYTGISVLLLPIAFKNGGFALSPIALFTAVLFESLSGYRLLNAARQFKVYSYPLLMEKALGVYGLHVSRIFLGLGHWTFCIG